MRPAGRVAELGSLDECIVVITEDMLRIFQRYDGDIDGWTRVGDAVEHRTLSDADWSEIRDLRHRLWLQQHEPVSSDFVKQTEQLLAEKVCDEHARNLLRHLI
jgi:hypothetical protein